MLAGFRRFFVWFLALENKFYYCFMGIFSGIYVFFANAGIVNNDDYFQLKIGEFIVKNHVFPTHDFLTWLGIQKDFRMSPYQWLYDVFVYGTHQVDGWIPLWTLMGTSAAASFLLLGYYIYLRTHSKLRALSYGLFAFIMGILNCNVFFQTRPQTFSIFLLLLTMVLLEKKRYLWLFPIYVLAFNWHAGMWPIFMMPPALYFFESASFKKKLILLLLPATLLLTPDPAYIFFLPFKMLVYVSSFNKTVQEWNSVFLSDSLLSMTVISAVMIYLCAIYLIFKYVVALVRNCKSRKTMVVAFLEALTLFAIFYLFSSSQRNLILVVFFLIPFSLVALSDKLTKKIPILFEYEELLLATVAGLVFLLAVANLVLLLVACRPISLLQDEVELARKIEMPSIQMVEYIKNNHIDRLYNQNYGIGGYLEYYGILPMYDNRLGAIGLPPDNDARFDYALEYQNSMTSKRKIMELTDKYDIKYLLLYNDESGRNAFTGEGDIMFQDEKYILFELKD